MTLDTTYRTRYSSHVAKRERQTRKGNTMQYATFSAHSTRNDNGLWRTVVTNDITRRTVATVYGSTRRDSESNAVPRVDGRITSWSGERDGEWHFATA